MNKRLKTFLSIFFVLALGFLLIACNKTMHTVTFDSDGGTSVESIKVEDGKLATKPTDPTKDGYTFIEWQLDGEEFLFTTPITDDITLKAFWEEDEAPATFTVTFDSDGGSNVASQTVEDGKLATKPANPTKAGHTFVEWQLNGVAFNFATAITANTTLKAVWEVNGTVYTVIFDVMGGESIEDSLVVEGEKLSRPADPVLADHIFDDWYLDNNFSEVFDFDVPITDDLTLYASFYLKLDAANSLVNILEHNEVTSKEYYVTGKIKSIDNTFYGNMTITDGINDFYVYGVSSFDGTVRYGDMEEKPVVGDTVYLVGPIKRFNENVELNNSRLVKFVVEDIDVDIDLDDYEEVDINTARDKAIDSKVIIEGVVAAITLENNSKPNGVYLVDDTNAMYVYDGNIAASVKVGDTIRVAGVRANFILATEVGFATQHGYQGAIQLAEAHLLEKEVGNSEFNKDWIEEISIKEIMDTDHRLENVTGTIFKVTAFVNKVPGTGFTNYYFNDLDNATGSYTYTMNNGNDFRWLDEFDGELRVVYLSVINARSNAAGVLYRFYPIAVGDLVTYNQEYNPEFAVKYYGVDQFEPIYLEGFSPDLEVVTSVSSEYLNIADIQLTYQSSNSEVAYFEEVNGKLIFKTGLTGKATITITGIDGTNTYFETIEVEVKEPAPIEYINVSQAVLVADETEVVVKGVVAASLVNQSGFYLIDETGIVAVRMSGTELAKLSLGNEVIIKGKKTHVRGSNDPSVSLGQLVIDSSEVVINYQGNHEYDDSFFITGFELADLAELDKLEEHSASVYLIEAKIVYVSSQYFSRYDLGSGSTTMQIYSSGAGQLSFLEPYQDQVVQVELALVNWNGNGYRAAIVSIIVDGIKIPSNQNFR